MMDQYHTCLRIDTTVKKTLVPFPLFSFLADLIGFQECAMYIFPVDFLYYHARLPDSAYWSKLLLRYRRKYF